MGQYISDKVNFSALSPSQYPDLGSYILAFDTSDGKLKKMDYLGTITVIEADYVSPNFTGSPTSTTATFGNNTTRIATTAFVQAAVAAITGFAITNITHSALKALKDTSALVPGFYRITDFHTIYDQPDFDGAGTQKYTVVTKTADTVIVTSTITYSTGFVPGEIVTGGTSGSTATVVGIENGVNSKPILANLSGPFTLTENITGSISGTVATYDSQLAIGNEPLIVFATSASEISGQAYSSLYPDDKITYDIDWVATEVMAATAKGRIIERIDDKGNRTDYDHRNVIFKRYNDGYGFWYSYKDNGNTSTDLLTFAALGTMNFLADFARIVPIALPPGYFLLPNNVFYGTTLGNTFSIFTLNNTFYGDAESNTFGIGCVANLIKGAFNGNTVSISFGNNTVGSSTYQCVFGGGCGGNIIGDNNNNCVFGLNFNNSSIGNGNNALDIGLNCSSLFIGNSNSHITIDGQCDTLQLGDSNSNIDFGKTCQNFVMGTSNQNIKFGNNCNNLTIGDGTYANTFGFSCSALTIPNGSYNNKFGNYCSSITTFVSPVINNEFGNNTLTLQNFTAATHVYATYYTKSEIMNDSNVGLVYMDPSNGLGNSPVAINS